MNELLFIATMIVCFLLIIVAYRFWGHLGLFCWIAFATIVANIEVAKCVDICGLSVTLGNVIYGSNFLATDIISETKGGQMSRKAVHIGFFTLGVFTILSQMSLLFIPNDIDMVSGAMKTLFKQVPQVCLASFAAYFVSNTLDTYLFDWIGKHTTKVWVKNNAATMLSQLVDSFLFTFLAFVGTFKFKDIVILSITTFTIKVIVAACDTPFLYWAKSISKKADKVKVMELLRKEL